MRVDAAALGAEGAHDSDIKDSPALVCSGPALHLHKTFHYHHYHHQDDSHIEDSTSQLWYLANYSTTQSHLCTRQCTFEALVIDWNILRPPVEAAQGTFLLFLLQSTLVQTSLYETAYLPWDISSAQAAAATWLEKCPPRLVHLVHCGAY